MPGHARRSHKNPFCPMISFTARAASARLRAVQARIPEPPGATPRPVRSQIGAARACEDEAAKYEGKLRSFVSASLRARMQTTQSKGQRRAGIPSAIRSLDGVWKSAEGWKDGWMFGCTKKSCKKWVRHGGTEAWHVGGGSGGLTRSGAGGEESSPKGNLRHHRARRIGRNLYIR